jgi:hypothetical protein
VNIKGKRHHLGLDKAKTQQPYHRLMSVPEPSPVRWESVVVLFDKFLDWCQKHRTAVTWLVNRYPSTLITAMRLYQPASMRRLGPG